MRRPYRSTYRIRAGGFLLLRNGGAEILLSSFLSDFVFLLRQKLSISVTPSERLNRLLERTFVENIADKGINLRRGRQGE